MATVECTECGAEIEAADNVINGEILPCPSCGAEMEVTSTKPLKVELAPEVREDWGE